MESQNGNAFSARVWSHNINKNKSLSGRSKFPGKPINPNS